MEFESVEISEEDDGPKHSLAGEYGGYMTAGVGYTFIKMAVLGAELPEDATVLVWATIKESKVEGADEDEEGVEDVR